MDEVNLSEERVMHAVHLVAAMAMYDLAKANGVSATEMFLSFMESRTARMLYDTQTRLWCDGPAEVEAVYSAEMSRKPTQPMACD